MREDAASTSAEWVGPLAATFAMQTTSAFLLRVIPTLAPVLIVEAGISESFIGYLVAVATFGSMAFLMAGAPLIRRHGPIRALQIGALLAGTGVLLIHVPTWLSLGAASFLIGLGYGPAPPAGSDILQRHAPKRHRALVFSMKQAGVPLGGVVAGVMLPPLSAVNWRLAVGAAALIAFAVVLIVQPIRAWVDRDRDRAQPLSFSAFLSWANLTTPATAMRLSPALPRLCYTGFCFAAAQGAWFAFFITFLVANLDFGLAGAGALFAIMQATGAVGRICLGALADRIGSTVGILRLVALASSATTTILAFAAPEWSEIALGLLAAAGGFTVASWNGVFLAEVAEVAPARRIAEATAGATFLVFVGYVAGPFAFALILDATGSYLASFLSVAALSLTATAVLRHGPLPR